MKDMYRVAIAILASEEDAGDAMQDTILSCWEKIDTLKKPQYFKTWLIRILINHCYTILREKEFILCWINVKKAQNMMNITLS